MRVYRLPNQEMLREELALYQNRDQTVERFKVVVKKVCETQWVILNL